ncbi:hypothetical protein [Actinomadura rupiterrae]|uniref:hypothetical protein n=1 Tax=Actinomadura rupiterrae TaxID=559627 RepID=UPI0020A58EA6|nr:hypothetical protein [Actinomadura rupiterrae]MCP2343387.1 hypothetical protein [Actinomadura rupiterrae]
MLTATARPAGPSARPAWWTRLAGVARGCWRVLVLCWAALCALVSAAVGTPPGVCSRLGHVLADEYRAGRAGAIDAETTEPHSDDPSADAVPSVTVQGVDL